MFAEDIDAFVPGTEIAGATSWSSGKKALGLRQFTVKDLDGNIFYFHHG